MGKLGNPSWVTAATCWCGQRAAVQRGQAPTEERPKWTSLVFFCSVCPGLGHWRQSPPPKTSNPSSQSGIPPSSSVETERLPGRQRHWWCHVGGMGWGGWECGGGTGGRVSPRSEQQRLSTPSNVLSASPQADCGGPKLASQTMG